MNEKMIKELIYDRQFWEPRRTSYIVDYGGQCFNDLVGWKILPRYRNQGRFRYDNRDVGRSTAYEQT